LYPVELAAERTAPSLVHHDLWLSHCEYINNLVHCDPPRQRRFSSTLASQWRGRGERPRPHLSLAKSGTGFLCSQIRIAPDPNSSAQLKISPSRRIGILSMDRFQAQNFYPPKETHSS